MKYFFKYWKNIKRNLKDRNLMLFLDFDGTLTPIVETPQKATISKKIKKLLKGLTQNPKYKIAIISGRALPDIKNKVGLKNIIYSGNHGLEIEGPKIKLKNPVSARYKAALKKIKNDLAKKLSSIKGIILEDKGLSLSIHYRLVDKALLLRVKDIICQYTASYLAENKIRIKTGKMVFEIRPPLDWDKGKVVLWLLARGEFILKGKRKPLPIYIGDDITDEDAFKALKNRGITIFVGRPKESDAKYYLRNTQEVAEFLKRFLGEL